MIPTGTTPTSMIRVVLPQHLRTLAGLDGEVMVTLTGPITQRSILDALEMRFPMLRGTIRNHVTGKRRPMVRFFADQEDVTHQSADALLPETIASGAMPFLIIGAIAGG